MGVDVLIVGGGFAGLSAGITLARANRSVVVVDEGRPRNSVSEHAHGMLGMDGKSPGDILDSARTEFLNFGGRIIRAKVEALRPSSAGGWLGQVSGHEPIESRACFVATGLVDVLPEIEGLPELWGKAVFHCPYCHGYEISGTKCAVIGGPNPPFTLHQALLMKLWSEEVDFITNGMILTPDEKHRLSSWGINIIEDDVIRMSMADDQSDANSVKIVLGGGRKTVYGSVFIGPEFVPNDQLLREAGGFSDGPWIPVGQNGETGVPGLWAGGNCVSSPDQIANAVAGGARAAISINHALLYSDVEASEMKMESGNTAL